MSSGAGARIVAGPCGPGLDRSHQEDPAGGEDPCGDPLEVTQTLSPPTTLVWNRPKNGQRYEATLLEGGVIRLSDGREFRSPSGAAMAVAEVVSYDGWYAWRVGDRGRANDLRHKLALGAID